MIALAIVSFESACAARLAATHSDFHGDDIWLFYQSRTVPLGSYLRGVFDVHPVPLHRLLDFAVCRLTPMHFGGAVALLLVLHWVSIVLFYRVLERLVATPLNPVFVALYGTYVYVGSLFIWWAAGAHRLPMICLTLVATLSYIAFRERHRLRDALGVVLGLVLALGFYEKAALYPTVLLGLEIAFWPRTASDSRRANFALLGVVFALTGVYFLVWRRLVGEHWGALYTDPVTLLRFTALGWELLLLPLFGGQHWPLSISVALVLLLVTTSIVLSRWNAVVWLVGFAAVSLSLVSTGLSLARTSLLGLFIPLGQRYYPDVVVVFLLFAAVSCRFALEGSRATRLDAFVDGAQGVLLATGLSLLIAIGSWSSLRGMIPALYPGEDRIATFMENLRWSLARVPRPVLLADGRTAEALDDSEYSRQSVLLEALGVPVKVTKPGRGVSRMNAQGYLVHTVSPSRNGP